MHRGGPKGHECLVCCWSGFKPRFAAHSCGAHMVEIRIYGMLSLFYSGYSMKIFQLHVHSWLVCFYSVHDLEKSLKVAKRYFHQSKRHTLLLFLSPFLQYMIFGERWRLLVFLKEDSDCHWDCLLAYYVYSLCAGSSLLAGDRACSNSLPWRTRPVSLLEKVEICFSSFGIWSWEGNRSLFGCLGLRKKKLRPHGSGPTASSTG